METKKINIQLNEVCVNRFLDARTAYELLRDKTQNFTYFASVNVSEAHCRKVADAYNEAYLRLGRHIEYVTKKALKRVTEDNIVVFKDGTKLKLAL